MRLFITRRTKRGIIERLFSLTSNTVTLSDVCDLTGLLPGSIVPVLANLERQGKITSHWGAQVSPGGPRRRLYVAAAAELRDPVNHREGDSR